MDGLAIRPVQGEEVPRFTDDKYNGFLANLSPSEFRQRFEMALPEKITGKEFTDLYGDHVDPATPVIPGHVYSIRANTRYAVLENNRVTLFYHLLNGCPTRGGLGESSSSASNIALYKQLGELMYQSHHAYIECGLGSTATSAIVDLVCAMGPESGLFGAKITGGGAGGTVAILGLRSAKDAFYRGVVEPYALARGLSEAPYVFAGSSLGADAFGIKTM